MTLSQGEIGKTYTVIGSTLDRDIETRLEVLGLTAGTKIQVMNRKKSGSIILKVRGTRLATGKKIAANIQVEAEQVLEEVKHGRLS